MLNLDHTGLISAASLDQKAQEIHVAAVKPLKTLQDQVIQMAHNAIVALPTLTIAIFVVIMTWLVARSAVRIADRMIIRSHLRADLRQLFETLVRITIWAFGLLLAGTIAIPGLTPASLFAGLGIGAVAIGFAFQDIFQNFLAGVLIMLRDKMNIGDQVTCQGITGTVERIMLRETHIRQGSGELTIVPNSVLFKNPVEVSTDQPDRRDELTLSIDLDNDLEIASAAIRRAAEGVKGISRTHPVDILLKDFTSGTVVILVRWWTAPLDRPTARSELLLGIKRELDEAGVAFPNSTSRLVLDMPDRTLPIPGSEPEAQALTRRG